MDTEITWQDPTGNGRGARSKWASTADELRKNPGRWAKLGAYGDASLVTAIRRGRRGFDPAGAFESRSSLDETGRRAIFARYVGEAAR